MKIQAIVTAADSLGGCMYATTDRQKRPLHWLLSHGVNQYQLAVTNSLSIQQITTEPYAGTISATLRY